MQAYEGMLFAKAVEAGYYVLQNARDEYRLACGPDGMQRELIEDYLRVSSPRCNAWPFCAALPRLLVLMGNAWCDERPRMAQTKSEQQGCGGQSSSPASEFYSYGIRPPALC